MKSTVTVSALSGKVCLITGAAGLLGQYFSRACAEAGAIVVMVDIDVKKGRGAAEKLSQETENAEIIFYQCDITKPAEVGALRDFVVKKYQRIDALVNNAYPRNKNYGRKFEDVTYGDFCENVNSHLGGYFLMSQVVAQVMRRQKNGVIINLGSIYGTSAPRFEIYEGTTMTMPVEYAAIKGGIVNLNKYLASYLGKHNIRVNCISPGGVFDRQPESFVKRYSEKVPLGGRMANPDDLTGALVFLLSDAAKYITGQNIVVDGGWTL